jgi:serine protease AprX
LQQASAVDPAVLAYAQQNPDATQNVIIKGVNGQATRAIAFFVNYAMQQNKAAKGWHSRLDRQFTYAINGVSATLTGRQIQFLSRIPLIESITEDAPVAKTDLVSGLVNGVTGTVGAVTNTVSSVLSGLNGASVWDQDTNIAALRAKATGAAVPTIAIVDTGVDAKGCHCNLTQQVDLYTGTHANNSTDGRGHGTMVAGVAAANSGLVTGAAPTAKVVSLDVLGDDGSGTESDAIAAADWILQNKDKLNIKVANFSLAAGQGTSIQYDPLDQAVEKLWLNGVTVVAAAGNYGTGSTPSGVVAAPGNDPFVITVGAADTNGTADPSDDFDAPWSAYGYTPDGFRKPELGAPGRQMVAGVASNASFLTDFADRVVSPGYMWMSGTSFSSPVVAGVAADIVAVHPDWTPDQVKGALMYTAKPYSASADPFSLGVGIVDGADAAAVVDPPNPNASLEQFVSTDPSTGTPTFAVASWAEAAQANASWAEASWAEASWAEASWAEASWAEASWAEASWAESSFAAASWAEASWAEASWAEASWAENVSNANSSAVG